MSKRGGNRPGAGAKPRFKLKDVEEALLASAGITGVAAQKLKEAYGGCTGQTIRNYMKRHPSLRAAVEEAREQNLDLAETKLLGALSEGKDWAIRFYLEMMGRHRGYTRRTEVVGVASAPVVVTDARQWLIDELDGMEARHGPQPGGSNGAAPPRGEAPSNPETLH